MMKNLTILALFILFCLSCEKDDFNVDHPNIQQFVQQLKSGTYDQYKTGENGEKLWTIMPNFSKEHIPLLIDFSKDTSLVCPCNHFPANPVSSIPPFRISDNKECIMLGEYLLWCAEAIIENRDFASLTPILVNRSYSAEKRPGGEEILEVREIYQNWWEEYGLSADTHPLPLAETDYYWR
ncbi:DUF4943 family protein [Saccharicrinis sp. FJH54]|uniref:DUF4943 family protein n=1 Tax=Saccharicrinis sp. FJH54 TaxID=3344665 RepID=UPI0035D3FF0E